MTHREGAIISAFTGFLCCPFTEMQKYIEEILERPVFTHELASSSVIQEIKEKSKDDFEKLINSQES